MSGGTLLLLNGDAGEPARLRRLARGAAFLVAADGGLRHALALGLAPRLVVGDMDSLPSPLPRLPGTVFFLDCDPDRSDFEKALAFLAERSAPAPVLVAGALGGRPDHAAVNLALAEAFADRIELVFVDGGEHRLLGPGRYAFPSRKGRLASLLPAGAGCRLSTRGLRYPLRGERLARGSRGLSNAATGRGFSITVHSGKVWLFQPEADVPARVRRK